MGDKDWEEKEIKEFIRLMKNYEKTWNPASEELKEKKELKIDTFITAKERDDLIFLNIRMSLPGLIQICLV
jgi:hypothetical protein